MPAGISTQQSPTQLTLNLALDESLYEFAEEERIFLKQQTGIQDDDELKAHIFRVQAEAYEVCTREPWDCCMQKLFMTEVV